MLTQNEFVQVMNDLELTTDTRQRYLDLGTHLYKDLWKSRIYFPPQVTTAQAFLSAGLTTENEIVWGRTEPTQFLHVLHERFWQSLYSYIDDSSKVEFTMTTKRDVTPLPPFADPEPSDKPIPVYPKKDEDDKPKPPPAAPVIDPEKPW